MLIQAEATALGFFVMGFHFDKKPQQVIIKLTALSDDDRELFRKFNILCVINEERKEIAYRDLVAAVVAGHREELDKRWVDWDGLEAIMLENKFTINRTTFWSYRNKGMFEGLVRTDGVTTLFEADGILAVFQSGGVNGQA